MRFPEYQNSWETLKLRDISEKVNEKNTNNDLDLVFSNSAVQGIVLQNDYFEKSIANRNNLQGYYIVKPQDFVYNPRISANAEVGAMNINNTFKTGLVSPLYTVFRIKSAKITPQFLEIYFKSKHWHSHMREIANYGARDDRMNIKNDDFYNMDLQVPQNDEQIKIISFLSKIIFRIETQKKTINQLNSQIEILVNLFMEEKLKLKGSYEKWKTFKLAEIGETFNGLTGKSKEDFGSGKRYIQYKQIFDSRTIDINECGFVEIDENENQSKVKFGDAFFTVSSETANEIGMSSVLLQEVDDTYMNSFCFGFRTFSHTALNPKFASFLFRSKVFRNTIVKLAQGSTRYNMSKNEFLKLKINLPTESEQIKISNILASLSEKLETEKRILALLEQQKKYFLQNLFI